MGGLRSLDSSFLQEEDNKSYYSKHTSSHTAITKHHDEVGPGGMLSSYDISFISNTVNIQQFDTSASERISREYTD